MTKINTNSTKVFVLNPDDKDEIYKTLLPYAGKVMFDEDDNGICHILQAGDSIRLWQANKLVGTPILELPEGIEWDTDRLAEGLLFVKSVSDGIVPLRYTQRESNDIYDLSGRLVRKDATSTEGLPSGIYVRRGKKIIVK